jgi:hypothetical protein
LNGKVFSGGTQRHSSLPGRKIRSQECSIRDGGCQAKRVAAAVAGG